MNLRAVLSALGMLLIALIVAIVTGIFSVALLHRTEPESVFRVRSADLREGEPVRVVAQDGSPAYVVQLDGNLIAYRGQAPTINRCDLEWQADKRYFLDDGCVGAQFDVTGRWLAGPAYRDLDRHPVRVQDDWVAVDTRTLIPGRDLWPDNTPWWRRSVVGK